MIKNFKGFSMAETLIVLFLLSILLVSLFPVMTTKKVSGQLESKSVKCIKNDLAINPENPTLSASCNDAKFYCQHSQNQACKTLIYFADHGKDETNHLEKTAARRILKETCDAGGKEACAYFVSSCKKDSATCNIVKGSPDTYNYDLYYYLNLPSTSTNIGKLSIFKEVSSVYTTANPNISNTINQICLGNYNSTACNLISNVCNSTYNTECKGIVSSCNNNVPNSCKLGYAANINQTCKQIKTKADMSNSGIYNITAGTNGDGTSTSVYCDMSTDGGGWTKIEYAADLPYQAQFPMENGDGWRWLPTDFQTVLPADKILAIQALSSEGKQTYVGLCNGVLAYFYPVSGTYGDAFKFKFINGATTPYAQQSYSPFNITVTQDGCAVNGGEGGQLSKATIFEFKDKNVPVVNVYTVDNSDSGEYFGSPLTQYPAWLR